MAKGTAVQRIAFRATGLGVVLALAALALVASPATATGSKITSTVVTNSAPAETGAPITFTATVTHGLQTPTGTVTFSIDPNGSTTSVVCSNNSTNMIGVTPASVGASAQCTISGGLLAADSPYSVTAVYSGDSTFAGSTGTLTRVIRAAPTTTTLTSSNNPSVTGQTLTYTATVATAPPSTVGPMVAGTVTFSIIGHDGTSFPCDNGDAQTLDSNDMAQCNLTAGLAANDSTYTVSAVYTDTADVNYATSNSSLTQTVLKATTTVTVTSSSPTLVTGQPVTFTATVSVDPPGSGIPAGSMVFTVTGNSNNPTTVSCDGGSVHPITTSMGVSTATCGFAKGLPSKPLSYTVSATLSDPNFKSPVAGTLTEPIARAATTTTLFGLPGSLVASEAFTFGVQVQTLAPGTGAPSGDLEFSICLNGASVCNGTTGAKGGTYLMPTPTAKEISNNRNNVEFSIPEGLQPGFWDVVANYEGNVDLTASTNATIGHIEVLTVPTTMDLFTSKSPVPAGGKLVIKAAVLADARATGSLGAPSGTVTFTITGSDSPTDILHCNAGDAVSITTNPANQGIARCVIAAGQLMSANSPYQIQAVYDGDNNYSGVTGTTSVGVAAG